MLIKEQEPKLQQLTEDIVKQAKSKGATDVEVSAGIDQGFSVTVRGGNVETIEHDQSRSIDITVLVEKKCGSASTNDMSSSSIARTIDAAIDIAKYTEEDPFLTMPDEKELAFDYVEPMLCFPWDVSVDQAVEMMLQCENAALTFDPNIKQSEGASLSTHKGVSVFANSQGFTGVSKASRHELSCCVIANSEQGMQRDYDYSTVRDAKDLKSVELIGKQAAMNALKRLNARKIPTQSAPVLFHYRTSSMLFRCLLSAISGSKIYKKASFLLDCLDQQIMPDFVQVNEVPLFEKGLGSAAFDSEGVRTRDKAIIDSGRLTTYLLSTYTGNQLNMKTTGNAGGVHNLHITPTVQHGFEEIAKTMGNGLLVTETMGSGINIVNGDFSVGVAGFWVENGEISFPVHEVTIAGNLTTMFKQILAIGNDINANQSMHVGSVLVEQMKIAGS